LWWIFEEKMTEEVLNYQLKPFSTACGLFRNKTTLNFGCFSDLSTKITSNTVVTQNIGWFRSVFTNRAA